MTPMPAVPPSGRQHRIERDGHELVVVEVGGGIRTYRLEGRDVLDGYPSDSVCDGGRGQVLAPWPNRLDGGSFEWEGKTYQLPIDEPEHSNAIHGLVRWLPWERDDVDPPGDAALRMRCRLHPRPGWPWPLDLSVTYELDGAGLKVTTTAENAGGAGSCPFALGWHPYIAAFGGLADDVVVAVPASTVYRADDRGLPLSSGPVEGTGSDFRGEGRPVGPDHVDSAFTDLERGADGRAVVTLTSAAAGLGARVWMDAAFGHVMVYTGDTLPDPTRRRRGIAVEPMTAAPNALRNRDGLHILHEGQLFQASWGVEPFKFRDFRADA